MTVPLPRMCMALGLIPSTRVERKGEGDERRQRTRGRETGRAGRTYQEITVEAHASEDGRKGICGQRTRILEIKHIHQGSVLSFWLKCLREKRSAN